MDEDLYQDAILRHSRHPHNEGILDPRTHEAEGLNPLCGDRIVVHVRRAEERIEAVRFTGAGCAISRASASIMTEAVQGLDGTALDAKIRQVLEMLAGKDDLATDPSASGDLAALLGVRRFPARIKCAALAWRTLVAAVNGSAG